MLGFLDPDLPKRGERKDTEAGAIDLNRPRTVR
jgi:hypothetical protein